MSFLKEILQRHIKTIPEYLSLTSKLGVLVGGICIIVYSLKIGHYPRELSLGDGLLFLTTAFVAGATALIFIGSLVCLGITLSFIPKGLLKLVIYLNHKYSDKKLKLHHTLVPFDWLAFLGSLYSVIIMLALAKKSPYVLVTFPLLSILVYVFISIYFSCDKKIKAISRGEPIDSIFINAEVKTAEERLKDLRQGQLASALFVLIIPFLLSGVTPQLLDGTMRILHIRTNHATILLQEPYASIVAGSTATEFPLESKVWKRFDDILVLSASYGKFTVISVDGTGKRPNLEIPNEKIIIE